MLHSELFELQCLKCNHSTFSLEKRSVCVNCREDSIEQTKQTTHLSGLKQISQPKSIVVKPTIGSFSRGYSAKSLLHVGVSDSLGNVFNFDERGVLIDNGGWKDCLCISLNDPFENGDNNDEISNKKPKTHWDKELNAHYFSERENLQTNRDLRYHQLQNNCYDFVLRFLNKIAFENRTNHTKEELVQTLIGTPVESLESFLIIMKRINDSNGDPFVLKTPTIEQGKKRETYRCDVCGEKIIGKRWRCQNTKTCTDFDICDSCQTTKRTQTPHEFSHELKLFE